MSRYRVTSRVAYRGFEYGTEFEEHLDEAVERRAITRGAIELLERSDPALKPGSYTLPRWRRTAQEEGRADAQPDTGQGDRAHGA